MVNSRLNIINDIDLEDLSIIDVTLRDGAHQVDFKWPIDYTKKHINIISKSETVNFIELGYWKQTQKSTNPFYNMDEKFLTSITEEETHFKKYSLMVDCHYCSHNSSDFPSEEEFGMGYLGFVQDQKI